MTDAEERIAILAAMFTLRRVMDTAGVYRLHGDPVTGAKLLLAIKQEEGNA